MENLRELQVQARNLERAGQVAAAIELYGRILAEPVADREGGVWARYAHLQAAGGRGAEAAQSYTLAADRYETANLGNLALWYCQRALRLDDGNAELLLRFGRLAAAAGYRRDARHGFVEFAEWAAEDDDKAAAAGALSEYLAIFPDDAAVRRRLAELTGESEAMPVVAAAPQGSAELPGTLPGLVHASQEQEERSGAGAPDEQTAPVDAVTAGESNPAAAVEQLEGFEPTSAEGMYEAPAPDPDGNAPATGRPRDAAPPERADEDREEDAGEDGEAAEPLPLLGFEEDSRSPGDGETDAGEALPLLGPGEDPIAARTEPVDPLRAARERVAADPDDLRLRRALLALLRERGDPELERSLAEAERHFASAGRAGDALEFVEELIRLRPLDTPLQQRRVEHALRAGDRPALVAAYLALAARHEAELDPSAARGALQRVLELDPANEQARAALASVTAAAAPPRDYVDLGELILSGAPEEVTRFQVAIGEPTGDEESDFAEILALFRRKVSESLDPKDAASHYDLGLAFKEMGLLDDAIVHLQSGLRGGANPLGTLEILGECFVLKGQTSLAARVFERATRLDGVADSDLVGVLYGLARCQEELDNVEDARGTLERVVAVDLSFRDAADRLQRLQSR